MTLSVRNVDAIPSDDVATWPYEALVTAIDRGLVPDWQPVFAEIRRSPWGPTARRVERYLEYRWHDGVSTLFALVLQRARDAAERSERDEVARRIRLALERSGLPAGEFARRIGTSPSRFSTYVSGRVIPSAALMVRIEAAADALAQDR